MNISVLGTGIVGRAHAGKLSELGHDVMVGTRDPVVTLKNDQSDRMGNPPFSAWLREHPSVKVGTLDQAASRGELVINALHGQNAVEFLTVLAKDLTGKVLLDISNPLDFTAGMPPTLFVSNTDSLAERIQKALPDVRVVKSLNTVNYKLQTDPGLLKGADHTVFVSGNDPYAKAQIKEILQAYGWKNILDLGDISTARGPEMLMALSMRLYPVLGNTPFNYKIVT